MALTDTIVAFTALGVAVVALLVSLAQLLQQYFATADGYRNCQESVMGLWATKTHRKFRFSQFRLEVFFQTPEIFLAGPGIEERNGQKLIDGTLEGRSDTLTPLEAFDPDAALAQPHDRDNPSVEEWIPLKGPIANPANELACWLPLLHWIHETTNASLVLAEQLQNGTSQCDQRSTLLGEKTIPALVFRKRSWDFQPPDVIRPVAKVVVSDIVILARRMGMRWKDLRPQDGVMHAEGHCHILTSTVSRTLGIVLNYSFSGKVRSVRGMMSTQPRAGILRSEQVEVYIPAPVADMLGFGIIGGTADLDVPRLQVGSQWDIPAALNELDASGSSGTTLLERLKTTPGFSFRMGDLVALTTPMAHQLGSSLVQVPSPSENVHGFTTSTTGRRAFRNSLEQYMEDHPTNKNEAYQKEESRLQEEHSAKEPLISIWPKPKGMQLELIREKYDEFKVEFPQWENKHEPWATTRDKAYLSSVHRCYDDLTTYHQRDKRYEYRELLAHHIRRCIFRPSSRALQGYSAEEEVRHWFREMEKIGDDMQIVGKFSKEEVMEAWIVMMFRACCWGACHFFLSGERAPFACYGSQLPVYIG